MWELIEANKRKSYLLFFGMFLILGTLGALIGATFIDPAYGAWFGLGGALLLWLILSAVAYFFGDDIVLNVAHATEVTQETAPQLYNVTEEMRIAASLPHMPRLFIINDSAMNAFATGIRPERSAIAVTEGLLEELNRDELQGVVAHEMSHIINRDVLFMSFAGVMLGAITMLSDGIVRGFAVGARSRRGLGSAGKHPALLLITFLFALLAPVFAQIFYFAISRKREYLADATAVRLTRYPEGLASALEKISSTVDNLIFFNRITAPMYIYDPMAFKDERREFNTWNSTHPPIHQRIKILRLMSGGASFRDYMTAYSKQVKDLNLIPSSALREKTAIPIRQGSSVPGEAAEKPTRKSIRDVRDILMATNGFIFIPCSCGLKIKLPPTIGETQMQCPRCGKFLVLPSITALVNKTAEQEKAKLNRTTTGETAGEKAPPPVYVRKSDGWESFSCSCGHTIQLSPLFKSTQINCRVCGTKIEIA